MCLCVILTRFMYSILMLENGIGLKCSLALWYWQKKKKPKKPMLAGPSLPHRPDCWPWLNQHGMQYDGVQWVLWALRKQCVCLRNNTCNVIVKWYDNNNGFGCLCPLSVGRPDGWSFSNGFLQFLLLQDAAHAKQGATTRKTIDLWSWFCSLFSYLNHPECKTGDGPPFGVPFNVQRLDFECEVTATVSIQ